MYCRLFSNVCAFACVNGLKFRGDSHTMEIAKIAVTFKECVQLISYTLCG